MATKKSTGTAEKKAASKTAAKAPAKSAAKKTAAKNAVAAPEAAVGQKKSPAHHEIAQLAHQYWEQRGRHHGSHEADWHRAEKELKG